MSINYNYNNLLAASWWWVGGGEMGEGAGATETETGNRGWRWGAWGPVGVEGSEGTGIAYRGRETTERVYRHANLPVIRTK